MHLINKKKNGFILIESMIIASITFLLISMYVKRIVWNIEKGDLYTINDDLLYMSNEELTFIDDVTNTINNDHDLREKLKDQEKVNTMEYKYCSDNMEFKITKGNIFLIEKDKSNLLYRELKILQVEDSFVVVPEYYKAYNLTY